MSMFVAELWCEQEVLEGGVHWKIVGRKDRQTHHLKLLLCQDHTLVFEGVGLRTASECWGTDSDAAKRRVLLWLNNEVSVIQVVVGATVGVYLLAGFLEVGINALALATAAHMLKPPGAAITLLRWHVAGLGHQPDVVLHQTRGRTEVDRTWKLGRSVEQVLEKGRVVPGNCQAQAVLAEQEGVDTVPFASKPQVAWAEDVHMHVLVHKHLLQNNRLETANAFHQDSVLHGYQALNQPLSHCSCCWPTKSPLGATAAPVNA